ncbi:unnamed protein product [Rotaria socialis]|uniref:Uncharacterized protein n=1 Tax=Rotaria socialis TaxID=392032 RepID=A0A820IZ35_9BILA|nr:unnamed protein product [Rotaria socialis]CAF3319532.1 unnamed protein product [Rotaria socialis]CAF3510433.1 unnamed protein product [Rotaria socialis]CAF3616224.1 unnamed protein product [Rotaria socialis]CAF3685829.1 unnamed protein product [Rotaria socialis]
MSSTPAPSSDAAPSARVQSASNKPKEESSTENRNAATTAQSSSRPPSAIKQSVTGENRPASAAKGDSTAIPALDPLAAAVAAASARPQSATKNTDGPASNDASNAVTSKRPASASAAAAAPGSRPPSAAKKSEDSAASNIASAPPGSRPPSASVGAAAAGSRPPSASVGAAAAGSRPSSAIKKTDDVTATYTIVEQDATLPKIDPSDPSITQPIIGRPPGAAKNVGSGDASATLARSVPLNSLPQGTPSSDANPSATALPKP